MTKSWERDRNFIHYIIKRFFRIIPAMAAFVIFAACIIGPMVTTLPLKEYFSNNLFKSYFLNIFLYTSYSLPGVFEMNPYPYAVNGSIWSLPIEFIMYFLIPVIYKIGGFIKGKAIIFITVGICLLSIIWQINFFDIRVVFYAMDLGQVISIIPFYFLGIMVSMIETDKKIFNIVAAIVLIFTFQSINISSIILRHLASYLLLPYIVFSIAFNKRERRFNFDDKFEISYGIFLYGFLVQQLMIYILYKKEIYLSAGCMLLLCLVISVILALFSSKYIEKPMQKLAKYIVNRI